jgi:hypothetical protein
MRILIAAIPPVRPRDVVGPVEVFGDAKQMNEGFVTLARPGKPGG